MVIKECLKCGALIKIIKDCNCVDCGIKCCSEEMKTLKPNDSDASFEKHVPEYEMCGSNIKVRVNHVMEDDHYIEWISYVYDNKEQLVYFKPGDNIETVFEYVSGGVLYAYCNKHKLFAKVVE